MVALPQKKIFPTITADTFTEGDDKNILVRQKHCKAAIINKEEMAMAKDAFDYCLSLLIN